MIKTHATMAHSVVIHQFKKDAQIALQDRKYKKAQELYTKAIETVISINGFQQTYPVEVAQLYGNRSLVFYKMGNFEHNLGDAYSSITIYSKYAKGYYRLGMAYKKLNCLPNAVNFLISAIDVCDDKEYHITCFSEIISILCEEKEEMDNLKLLPDPANDIKQPILERLASMSRWKGINYLIVGTIEGVDSKLNGGFSKCDCSKLSVMKLLKDTTIQQKREWALKLATVLFVKGSSFANFEDELNGKSLHFAIILSIETGSVDFLRDLLPSWLTQKAKDRKDESGNTGIHVVVKSNIIKTTLGETILGLLVNHGCETILKDNCGKTPIEYLTQSDQTYTLIEKSLRRRIESVKSNGNRDLDGGNLESALKWYKEGLELCGSIPDFRRERAVLYSNRANTYCRLEQHDLALKDAIEVIAADNTWGKGYWRKGQELSLLERYEEAFDTWIGAVNVNGLSKDTVADLLADAATVFSTLEDSRKIDRYKAFYSNVASEVWSKTLIRLSKREDWLAIRYLILGTSMERSNESVGVASQSDTTKLMYRTVFTYLEKEKHTREISTWLTPTLLFLLFTKDQNYLNFRSGTEDTCINASVRYALITGDVSILQQIPMKVTPNKEENCDGSKESPYHVVKKYKHSSDTSTLKKMSLILQEKGYTASIKDNEGRLPIDYIKEEQDSQLNKMSTISHKENSNIVDTMHMPEYDIQHLTMREYDFYTLMQLGKQESKQNSFENALHIYSRALEVLMEPSPFKLNKNIDVALVNVEMAKCYLELKHDDLALAAAQESIKHVPNCVLAYVHKGTALTRTGRDEESFHTFENAMRLTSEADFENCQTQNDRTFLTKVILKAICVPYVRLRTKNATKYPENLLSILEIDKRPYHPIWQQIIYELVLEEELSAAKFAFVQLQFQAGAVLTKLDFDLRPLCDLGLIKQCPWLMSYIYYLLQWHLCDYKQLSTQPGDTYFHAVVRMTLITGNFMLLQLLSGQSNKQGDSTNFTPMLWELLEIQTNINVIDSDGSTALHAATSMKLEDTNTRYRTISFLISLGIDSNIVNEEGKLAVGYLPKKEKKSIQKIKCYMKTSKVRASSVEANTSVSAQLQNTVNYVVPLERNSESNHEQNRHHKSQSEEDKCSSCKDKLNWCQNNICSNRDKSFKEIIKVIRNSKHKSITHKCIVEKCIALMTDFIMNDATESSK